jgi:indolepyruvate ferredoxin oxidoreductase beta subunit
VTPFNIYIVGVGGQGVGLTADALSSAISYEGHRVLCADTHGLAQRGGISSSHLRIGDSVTHPLIAPNNAQLVIALERLEALRATREMLEPEGLLVYCDMVFQPASVRIGESRYPTEEDVNAAVMEKRGRVHHAAIDTLEDARMVNTLLVAHLIALQAVPGLTVDGILRAMSVALPDAVYQKNRALLLSACADFTNSQTK